MIALITDFGHTDHYAGIMKGVIKGIHPSADIVDISHSVFSFSVLNAQFILQSSYRNFPNGTIFCVVVDPGVGTNRRCLIARDHEYSFVLPDNGIISAIPSKTMSFYNINMNNFHGTSATFHGRDIFAPVSARMDMGSEPSEFGYKTENPVQVKFPPFTLQDKALEGFVVHIDHFGNIITSIPNKEIEIGSGLQYRVSTGSCKTGPVSCRTYGDIPEGATGILHGSSGFIEISMNRASAAMKCNAHIDGPVSIAYENC